MKLRFLALTTLFLCSASAFASDVFTCSVFETNEKGEVSDALYTRGVPLTENGNASLAFQNEYFAYEMSVAARRGASIGEVKASFRAADGSNANVVGNIDFRSQSKMELRLIVNSYKPDGNFVSEVRLYCSVQ